MRMILHNYLVIVVLSARYDFGLCHLVTGCNIFGNIKVLINPMSDEKLLEISYRNPSKFGELFDRHYSRFFKVAKKTLRTKDDAEDVVQEVFIRIYKYGKKFPQKGGKFLPWANTVLKNCMADQITKYKNASVVSSLTEEIENVTPASDSSQEEQLENYDKKIFEDKNYVKTVLNKMEGSTAEIINLRYVLGKSFKEIAKMLNIKNSTARVRAHRSKKIFVDMYRQLTQNYGK